MRGVSPEFQGLALGIEQQDFGAFEDGRCTGPDVVAQQHIAAFERAAELWSHAEEQVQFAVAVPVHQYRIAVPAVETVVRSLRAAPMVPGRRIGLSVPSHLLVAHPHALRRSKAQRVRRQGLVPEDVALHTANQQIRRSRTPPVPHRGNADVSSVHARFALLYLPGVGVHRTALIVAAIVPAPAHIRGEISGKQVYPPRLVERGNSDRDKIRQSGKRSPVKREQLSGSAPTGRSTGFEKREVENIAVGVKQEQPCRGGRWGLLARADRPAEVSAV